MNVLVTYASRYGATAGIAERVAATLRAEGVDANARPVDEVRDVAGIDAFVVGAAVYIGSWLKPATAFVERNREALAGHPVWLFSSGPLPGAVVPAKKGPHGEPESDPGDATPKGIDDLVASLGARDHRVFDGALDPAKLGLRDKAIRALPVGKGLLPEVDGRDWPAIEKWAKEIARELTGA
jgi:menaquinone-dependent protoporphyrinogen oxidase